MTMTEQYSTTERVKAFIETYGLKQKYVASKCGIPEKAFSSFVNGKLALSTRQFSRVVAFIDDYTRRNS